MANNSDETTTDSSPGFIALGAPAAPSHGFPNRLRGFGGPAINVSGLGAPAAPSSNSQSFGAPAATNSGCWGSHQTKHPFTNGVAKASNLQLFRDDPQCCGEDPLSYFYSRTEPPSKDDPLSIYFDEYRVQLKQQGKDLPWSWDSRIRCNSLDVRNLVHFNNTEFENLDLTDIWTRKLTFKNNWPLQMSQSTLEMAEAGYYYVGPGDTVRCAFCGGYINAFMRHENPKFSHIAWGRVFGKHCKWAENNFGETFNAKFCKK